MKGRKFGLVIALQADRLEDMLAQLDDLRGAIEAKRGRCQEVIRTLNYDGVCVVTEAAE